MKKFQKLYQLKQIVKADAEYSKYCRLTNKLNHDPSLDEKLKEASANVIVVADSRLLHIVYSLLKGKSYQKIENSVREQNQLKEYEWKQIVDMMNKYKDEENTNVIPVPPFPTTKINVPKVKEITNE